MSYDALAKVILIGPSGTGKSNLLLRMEHDRFTPKHDETIGVEFGNKIVPVDRAKLKLQIWDTAGKEEFRSITRSYYRSAHVVCVAWDASKLQQINNLEAWVREAKEKALENARFIFVRTKSDLDNTSEGASDAQIAEQIEEVKAIASRCNIDEPTILAASAKDNEGIKKLTDKIAEVGLSVVRALVEKAAGSEMVPAPVPLYAQPSEPFFLVERYRKIQHSRKPRVAELQICFEKEEPSEQDITWLLLHLDSVEENCQTARDIRNYLGGRVQLERPKTGPVVELLKLLDEEERAKFPKFVTLMTWASYSDLYIAERDVERKFILDVAKNIYSGKEAFKDLERSEAPKAVLDIVKKYSPGLLQ